MSVPRATTTRPRLLLAMVAAVAAVLALALWSNSLELELALPRLGHQQAVLALSVANDLGSRAELFRENERLARAAGKTSAGPEHFPGSVLAHLGALERDGHMLVLVREIGQRWFERTDHRPVDNELLDRAFARGDRWVVLPRDNAVTLGLALNRAVAGLAEVNPPDRHAPSLQIAVITSAAPERERVFRAQWRDALTGLTAIAIVLWFGRLTLAQQRRELQLAAQLERVKLEHERDAQLSRAGRFAMLAAMSTGIAHELGTPLSVIVGRLEQLSPLGERDDMIARALRSMNEQAERMSGIIRGFLGLARGETPILEQTSPTDVVEAARELVRHRFVNADVGLTVEAGPDLPAVSLDRRLFTQAVVNLLINACDASQAGDSVTLSVHTHDHFVVFDVLDCGQGIEPDIVKRATEPFFTTRASHGGTGLGLAIANEITQQHGGTLELSPNQADARGTRARIKLPLAAAARAPEGSST